MANRRAIGSAISSFGDSMADYFARQATNKNISDRQAAEQSRGADITGQQKSSDFVKTMLEKLLEKNPVTQRDYIKKLGGPQIDPRDIDSPIADLIAKGDSEGKTLTPEDIRGMYQTHGGEMATHLDKGPLNNPTDGKLPSSNVSLSENDRLKALLGQGAAKQTQQKSIADSALEGVESMDPTGAKSKQFIPKGELPGKTFQTGLGASQMGANKQTELLGGELSPAVTSAKAKQVGAETGAREAAALPYQIKLAQVHADQRLLEAQKLDEYKRAHPHATSQEINRSRAANTALGMITENRAMLDELEKQGLTGPLKSRGADIAAGKIKAEDLFANPDQAKLVADYFSSMGFLRSLATVAHGGARGGGSPAMDAIFQHLISGVGDKSIVSGQLDALERLMKKYADDPTALVESDMNIPGMPQANPADSLLEQLRKRASGTAMPPVPFAVSHGGMKK